METAEFDRFADEYHAMHRRNIAITGEDPSYFSAYKIRVWSEWLLANNIRADRILDFGAGIGNSIPYFREFLASSHLTCADVSQRSLDLARARFPGGETQLRIDGARIPAPDGVFDAVFSACVFHHIPHEAHVSWLRELRRVTAPGGAIAIFEHNPLNPITVRAVNTCPFDANAKLIPARRFAARLRDAGWDDVITRYHVFFPRALAALRRLDGALARVPLGAQYAVMAMKRRDGE
jgi:SAM-dependent methyltransferase